ncbi:MAG: type II secretion system protein GspL [Pseudomonadota bacterium]
MTTLFIRVAGPAITLDEAGQLEAEWLIGEPDGGVRAEGRTDLRGLSELVDPDSEWIKNRANVVLLVPTDLVLNVNCDVPGRNAAQVRRALPFVVEEFVATDIESMHVAAGEFRRGEPIRASVIERKMLEDWLRLLEQAGIRPGYAMVDADLLGARAGEGSFLFDGNQLLVRTSETTASLDPENLEFVIGSIVEQCGDEPQLEIINGTLDPLLVAQLPPETTVDVTELEAGETVLGFLAQRWLRKGPSTDMVNLLQGDYAVSLDRGSSGGGWRSVATLAAAWFGIALLALGAKGIYANMQAEKLNDQTASLYKDIYPAARRVPPNPQRQMTLYMGGTAEETADFIPLLARLSSHMDAGVKLRSVNYQGTRKELSCELILSGFDALEGLKDKLDGEGLGVDISSADQQADGVHARLRIRSPGA